VRAIVIGAGRGSRLGPLTDELPKCYAEVAGQRILDHTLAALRDAGINDVVFVGGYRIERIRTDYPALSFRHNVEWANNNILASLFYAEDAMDEGFVCSYADILYRPRLVERLLAAPGAIALGIDTAWRARYADRRQHPEEDAEKVRLDGDRVLEVSRAIPSRNADGEYVGLARFSAEGARVLRAHHRRAGLGPKAYLVELLQAMIAAGVEMRAAATEGDYFEVDTSEDYELAQAAWGGGSDAALKMTSGG
jgi:choline kinase